MFTARIERLIAAAHHNGPPGHKCRTNHGHDWRVVVEISYGDEVVDGSPSGWGPDFGVVKAVIDAYDHQDLNERFGGQPASAENFARRLYREVAEGTGCEPDFVEVNEGNANRVTYRAERR